MSVYTRPSPTNENYWRSIILFGSNTTSYKFGLGKSLLEIAQRNIDFVSLEDLAAPFAKHICAHQRKENRQGTNPSNTFLDSCQKYETGEISHSDLIDMTVAQGFRYVIDRFHHVAKSEVDVRFFIDERKTSRKGLRLTDELLSLPPKPHFSNLAHEVEARWNLVETAWNLRMPADLLEIYRDPATELLIAGQRGRRRKPVTGCREALIGYQKGTCFYCSRGITIDDSGDSAVAVDHFLPHHLYRNGHINIDLDRIWNLVLACSDCNSMANKGDRIPHKKFLERLETRNNFYISSHHPLRETLIDQTGRSPSNRRAFLQNAFNEAYTLLPVLWPPPSEEGSVW